MPPRTIEVIACVTAQASNCHEVLALLRAIVAPTRQESSYLNYRMYRCRKSNAMSHLCNSMERHDVIQPVDGRLP